MCIRDRGKTYPEARGEVVTSADIIDWYAEEGRRSYGRIVPGRGKGVRQLVIQEPIGIVAAFTPWNFPVLTPARKIGGALAAGCSLILKASEETPGACIEMVRCFADVGLPAGVLNLVFGVPSEVSEYLLSKDAIRKISFTGSIPVGKHLAALAAKGMKRTTMEPVSYTHLNRAHRLCGNHEQDRLGTRSFGKVVCNGDAIVDAHTRQEQAFAFGRELCGIRRIVLPQRDLATSARAGQRQRAAPSARSDDCDCLLYTSIERYP